METSGFSNLLTEIDRLTPSQRLKIIETLTTQVKSRESVTIIEERVSNDRPCPRCGKPGATRRGVARGLQRYHCSHCKRTFNALTGTPLAGLRKKEKWLEYGRALKDSLTLEKAAGLCDVHLSTAFRWRHRFLKAFSSDKASVLTGIVEADETFFLESFKGQMRLPRESRERGGKAAKPGLSDEQIPVLIARDRNGETFDAILAGIDKEHLGAALKPVMGKDSLLCTDGSGAFKAMAKEAGIPHQSMNVKAGVRVKERIFHIQNVNAYDSRLKGWMRPFHGVATRYLGNYLGWRRFFERQAKDACNPRFWLIEAIGRPPG